MSGHFSLPEKDVGGRAFTLVEMMAATAILSAILLLVFSITRQTGEAWKNSASKIESFQGARAAFETMTRTISQATLNTYYDYFAANGERRTNANVASFVPAKYGRYSDLHFVSGKNLLDGGGGPTQITHSMFFQTGAGYTGSADYKHLDTTLNAVGFYVEYGADPSYPKFLQPENNRNRYRLMQFFQPSTELSVYEPGGLSGPTSWFKDPLKDKPELRRPLTENVVALVIHPKLSDLDKSAAGSYLAPDFEYDSRISWTAGPQPKTQHQLPPLVEIVLVAIEESSFATAFGNPPNAPDLGQLATSNLFQRAEQLDGTLNSDLAAFESVLNAAPGNIAGNTRKLKYRIFRSEIPIRSAKWSE